MTQTRRSGSATTQEPPANNLDTAMVQPAPSAEQWSQLCQTHYELGLIEGYARGYADADAELVGALAEAFGGPGETDYGRALKAHERMSDQAKRRRESDAHAAEPRPGDFPGGVPLPPTIPRAPESRPGDYPGRAAA